MTDEQINQWAKDSGMSALSLIDVGHLRNFAKLVRNAALDEAKADLLEAGFKSTGVPAYEGLAERIERLKS